MELILIQFDCNNSDGNTTADIVRVANRAIGRSLLFFQLMCLAEIFVYHCFLEARTAGWDNEKHAFS